MLLDAFSKPISAVTELFSLYNHKVELNRFAVVLFLLFENGIVFYHVVFLEGHPFSMIVLSG